MESGEPGATPALVQMLGARGRHDEAWRLLKEALEKTPDDSVLMELAAELAQVRGRFGEAAHWLKRALDKQPPKPKPMLGDPSCPTTIALAAQSIASLRPPPENAPHPKTF
jgi:tetratricopeptide (TPR) repeat protein